MPPFWGAGKIPSATQSSLVTFELPPLPGPAVTLFHSTHLSSLEGSRRKTAALLVSGSTDSDQLFILRWWAARLFVTVSCPAHLSHALVSWPSQVVGFHPPLSGVIQLEREPYSYTTHA